MAISRKSKSILEEISSYVPNKSKEDIIESRAQHVIASAIHILESIDKTFSEEEATALKKRFISSIRGSDPDRFTRMVRRIKSGEMSEDEDNGQ